MTPAFSDKMLVRSQAGQSSPIEVKHRLETFWGVAFQFVKTLIDLFKLS